LNRVAVRVVLHPAHRGGPLPQGTVVWGSEAFWTIAIGSLEPCASQNLSDARCGSCWNPDGPLPGLTLSYYAPECVLNAALNIVRRQRSPNVW